MVTDVYINMINNRWIQVLRLDHEHQEKDNRQSKSVSLLIFFLTIRNQICNRNIVDR